MEIVRVEPHSHLLCQLQSNDPWHSCLLIGYRNVSAQPITAIRFDVSFINAMMESEPSVYSYDDSRKVKPGKTQVALWGDGVYWQKYGDKMSASVRVVKVMFEDGTFWTPPPTPAEIQAMTAQQQAEFAQRKRLANSIVDGMAGLFPNASVKVTNTVVAFYDDNADSRMCSVVKSGRTILQTVGTTAITVSSKTGEVCRFDLTQ